jgi:hypothetical protein
LRVFFMAYLLEIYEVLDFDSLFVTNLAVNLRICLPSSVVDF